MKAKDNKKILLAFGALSLAALLILSTLPNINLSLRGGSARGMFDGYYKRGIITIRAHQINNWDDYRFIAAHEWGHHVYDKYATKDDLKAWFSAFEKCGVQSDYTKTYKSKTVRLYEEWAEMYAAMKTSIGPQPCPEKLAVLSKYG